MKIKKEQLLIIIAVMLFLLLIFQIYQLKIKVNQVKNFELKILKAQQLNRNLEADYYEKLKHNNLKNNQMILKDFDTLILAKLEQFNLKMIDFSSTETELNLNLTGDFHSILHFIHFLEVKVGKLNITNFKIKDRAEDLFLFIKIEKELV